MLPLYHVYHVSGTRADALVRFSRRRAGAIIPTLFSTFPLSDLEEVDVNAYTQWLAVWNSELREAGGARDDQPDSSAKETSVTAGVDENADQNDSATAAYNKFLSYQTFKDRTGMRNDECRRSTLRVRDFFLSLSVPRVRATRFVTMRPVWCIVPFVRLCTRASLMKYSR